MPVDFKKTEKNLYLPKTTPSIINVPEMVFIMVDGKGNPNTCEAYKNSIEILYGLSWSIKMSKMNRSQPTGYYEYVVPPLEGLWWGEDGFGDVTTIMDKDKLCWISMIRQPEFVTAEVFDSVKNAHAKKKPNLDLSQARLEKFAEGLCVQALHIGSYNEEPATITLMDRHAVENGHAIDFSQYRWHHEIYLNDPRKIAPEKLKTVIRHPVRKV